MTTGLVWDERLMWHDTGTRFGPAGGGNVARRFATTRVGPDGDSIARLAAGAGIAAVDAVLAGRVDNAYCLHRPPGHHAEPDEAMGFCIYSNAAIAGLYALDAAGLARIAFVDWDAHHGNGTQAAFRGDPRALTISLHQDGSFPPGSGAVDEIGEGGAVGTNINIPLPPGSGEGAWLAAFERIVLPALAGSPWQALQPHQDRAIAAAQENGLAALMAR